MFHTKVCNKWWWSSRSVSFIFWPHSFQKGFREYITFFLGKRKWHHVIPLIILQSRYIAKTSWCTSKDLLFHLYFTAFFTLFLILWEPFDLRYSFYTCSHIAHPLHLASLLLICHELDFRLWKSSNWIFQNKSNSEDTTHSQNGWSWKAPLEIICQLVEGVLSLFRLLMVMLNDTELRICPWDTPPVTCVQLSFVALVTILWALQLIPFSMPFTVHFLVCTSLACLQGWMGCSWKPH